MYRKILSLVFLLNFFSIQLHADSITSTIMHASLMDNHQWQAVNNLWCASFYNAYKDLPFDQIDCDIENASREALLDYLQRRFDKYRLIAIQDSYSLVLAYKDEQLVGYTLYHMLEPQAIIHIDHFAVDPNCQGQGIGRTLLESTIKSAPEIIAVVLTTRILNKQAQGFYKKQGFYELTSIDNLVFDARYSILLQKDIKG
jgi:ribosomal protein S18 acetylase RimI-like enzyme